jgi:hypothetical protein
VNFLSISLGMMGMYDIRRNDGVCGSVLMWRMFFSREQQTMYDFFFIFLFAPYKEDIPVVLWGWGLFFYEMSIVI